MIADGAAGLITDSWDVLREYEAIYPHKILGERVELPRTLGYQAREEQARAKQAAAEEVPSLLTLNLKTNDAGLTDDQIAILRTLKDGALQVDDLIEKDADPHAPCSFRAHDDGARGLRRAGQRQAFFFDRHTTGGITFMAKKHLVIVESPAKAKTIGKYLGKDYEVKASMGHLRDLPKSKLGVDIEHDFEPVYQPIRGKEELISELKKAAKSSDTVYLATDPDREGEAISWHLKALLNLDDEKAKRVTFNEITKKVVSESIKRAARHRPGLVDAQQARRVLDRIVGYQLSPLLWKKVRRGLSAGRVQSVAVRMVDDREKGNSGLRGAGILDT